jgi:DNA (cytosine-5)-methyltransferase 1
MKHISLFSGGGGFDLASEWAGWTNVASCEIEDFQNTILEYYWPDAYHHRDIKTLTGKIIEHEAIQRYGTGWRRDGVIITGGFPCQPFSQAGKRRGAKDDRYLWPEMFRIIKEVRPDWVVAENVAGITSMAFPGKVSTLGGQANIFGESDQIHELRQEYILDSIINDLESEGYSVQPFIIPACAVGAPHRRDRIWIVANPTMFRCNSNNVKGEGIQWKIKTCREVGAGGSTITPNAENIRLQQPREARSGQYGFKNDNSNGTSSNPLKTGLQRDERHKKDEGENKEWREGTYGATSQFFRGSDWAGWPTQSPVCSRDDGISERLDSITFSKWRQESIKTFGNAIVPQVAFEIFSAIENVKDVLRKFEGQ